jgi:predicted TIM-barrel fold metal-dependent hydrolase
MRIDAFCHVMPPKFMEVFRKKVVVPYYVDAMSTLWDLDARFRIMDRYEDYRQVISLSSPSLESVASPDTAAELARVANDAMADLLSRHPDRFVAAVAALPMNDVDAAVIEAERAIEQLDLRGVQVYTPVVDKPLDLFEFEPLWEKMTSYDLPIWVHPHREENVVDYGSEKHSRFNLMITLGWPYETSAFMARMAYSGMLEKYSEVKFITHHAGAMIPSLAKRVEWFTQPEFWPEHSQPTYPLKQHPIEYMKRFYCDTAINGHTAGLDCTRDFFGADHLVFATDAPYPTPDGSLAITETIRSMEEMELTNVEREQIYEGNVRRLLHIPV